MKKMFFLLFTLLFVQGVLAAQVQLSDYPKIKLYNQNYELKFSDCSAKSKSCMNEYYKPNEQEWQWTELITVHYFGEQDNVLDYSKLLQKSVPYAADIIYNENIDAAIVSFLLPYTDMSENKEYVEQNIFRIEKSPNKKGLVAFQYACKHPFDTQEERKNSKSEIKKAQEKYLKIIYDVKIPPIVMKSFRNW